MTRKQLRNKIKKIEDKIQQLCLEKRELEIQELKLCDKDQYYKERLIKRKNGSEDLVGEIFFKENFTDEDTGEVIVIDRVSRVMENGKWFVG